MKDLKSTSLPREILWNAAAELRWLLFVYDWDTIVLTEDITISLSVGLNLCTEFFPCSISLLGKSSGAIHLSGGGYFSCLADLGCSAISLQSVRLMCFNRDDSNSTIRLQGSLLDVLNVSFTDCKSDTDGGVIQSYDGSVVSINFCEFHNINSRGFGGAVAAFGTNLSIYNSIFKNCSAQRGGGAIWSSSFQGCYGSLQEMNCSLIISNSNFFECSTEGPGGAVLADSGVSSSNGEVLAVKIQYTIFSHCRADAEGGALRASGASVAAILNFAQFTSCNSFASGGAISASDGSLSLISCIVQYNYAFGLGGGAVHLNKSHFLLYNTTISDNYALSGGGGALFWQGSVRPSLIGCPVGMKSVSVFCPSAKAKLGLVQCAVSTCSPCSYGSYQEEQNAIQCFPCNRGTFADVQGSTTCTKCSIGKYSTTDGSAQCLACSSGSYTSMSGSSLCISCSAGKYSSAFGGVSSEECIDCEQGSYSEAGASECSICVVGIYSAAKYFSQQVLFNLSQCFPESAHTGIVGRVVQNQNQSSHNSELMYWVIAPEGASEITLVFTFFNVMLCCQYVAIYACYSTSCLPDGRHTLGNFSGSLLPGPVDCPTGIMLIVWSSDVVETLSGWSASYQGSKDGNSSIRVGDAYSSQVVWEDLRHANVAGNHSRSAQYSAAVREQFRSGSQNKILMRNSRFNSLAVAQQPLRTGLSSVLTQGQRFSLLASVSTSPIDELSLMGLCEANNAAMYGSCIATDYNSLEVIYAMDPVYAGIPFNITVLMKDAYNQTILSDSSSLVQVDVFSKGGSEGLVSIVGSSLARFSQGAASLVFAIKPSFARIDFVNGFVSLGCQVYFSLGGSDAQTQVTIGSDDKFVNMQQGATVCPAGYVLVTGQENAVNGSAVCTFCNPGTYSVFPLAHVPGFPGLAAGCFTCPAGGDCSKGGKEIQFQVGVWSILGGLYILISCPAGYQLINSTSGTSKGIFSNALQECRACLPGQYIINPDFDACQQCPPGSNFQLCLYSLVIFLILMILNVFIQVPIVQTA